MLTVTTHSRAAALLIVNGGVLSVDGDTYSTSAALVAVETSAFGLRI